MKHFFTAFLFLILNTTAHAASGLLFHVTATDSEISVTTVAKHHTYPNAGIKINKGGYHITDCHKSSTGYCLFSVNDTAPTSIPIDGSGKSIGITLCLNAKGPLSCQVYNVHVGKVARRLYVIDYTNEETPIQLCQLDPVTQLITTCESAIGDSSNVNAYDVQSITLNDDETRAYIETDTDVMYQCDVDETTSPSHLLKNCQKPGIDFDSYYGLITLYPSGALSGTYAYFIDYSHTGIQACPITAGVMDPDTCAEALAEDDDDILSSYAAGIVFNTIDGTDYVYIGNYDLPYVTVCTVDSPTHFSSCHKITGAGSVSFSEPSGLAFNPANGLLYITDYNVNKVYACDPTQADKHKKFASCKKVASSVNGISDPWGININDQGSMVYVSDYSDTVLNCPVNNDGVTLGTCVDYDDFDEAIGMAIGYQLSE